jgi:SSS family solute:Na+ symporter
MQSRVIILVAVYAAALLLLSGRRRGGGGVDYLLAGRRLTLPVFVATLVTTWYGGILGIGEYAWRFGISTWLVFGVPYYLSAVLFALWLAPRLRVSGAVSIPDLLATAYGRPASMTGAAAVYASTVPVAYLLMLGVLLAQVTGWPLWPAVLVAAIFSAVYVGLSGFRAVVRTDVLQFVLMYGGFFLLLPAALAHTGGLSGLWAQLPATHRAWDGGLGWQTVLVWYLIALQTVVEPAFYQRVFAARDPRTARTGVLVSVALWVVFDFLTVFSGLAARVLLPALDDPMAAYPELASLVLSPWIAAVFMVGLFATVMSTLDSYLFIAATTIGNDLAPDEPDPEVVRRRTRIGLLVSAGLAVGGALLFTSAVQVWHHVGSVVTSALLLPVLAVNLPPRWRPRGWAAAAAMIAAAATAVAWIASSGPSGYPLGVEPMFPALATAAGCLIGGLVVGEIATRRSKRRRI